MHDGDGAHASLGLEEGHTSPPRRQPAGLEPQQGRDGLQVVLHPMVHLANGRVLGEQEAVEPAHVGHVAEQHEASGDPRGADERGAMEQHGDVGPTLDLLDDGKS